MNVAHRAQLRDSDSFKTFLAFPQETQPLVYLWKRDQADSPDFIPANEAEVAEAKSVTTADDTSNGSRGSVQTVWAKRVKQIDDWKCVVCPESMRVNLIGAHLIPVKPMQPGMTGAQKAALRAANLEDAYEARNGMTMCSNCSILFDKGFFYFEGDGTFWISDALKLSNAVWAAREGTKISRTTKRLLAENWPSEPIIAFRRNFCMEMQKQRHKHDDKPFQCSKCGTGYKQEKKYHEHIASCTLNMLKTPVKEEGKK